MTIVYRHRCRIMAHLAVVLVCGGLAACANYRTPSASASPYITARAGDVLEVQLKELRPTQLAVGYDQIYYHLGRKQPDLNRYAPTAEGYRHNADDNYSRYLDRTERKRVDDYCLDNGQGGVEESRYQPTRTRLIDPSTFACSLPPPVRGTDQAGDLKTVVIGPDGVLFLTDGHHTFTTLVELADGGHDLRVWVRVADNFSNVASTDEFWQRMQDRQFVWLRDADDQPITPDRLPEHLGLSALQDDRYRSLVYLTRDLGYGNNNVGEFAEFNWATWLRGTGYSLDHYDLDDLSPSGITVNNGRAEPRVGDSETGYAAAVRNAALLMVALDAAAVVANGKTATDLGQMKVPADARIWNRVLENDVWRTDTNSDGQYRTAGKAWYARRYRACVAAGDTQPACWQ